MKHHSKQFKKLYQNIIEEKYKPMEESTTWQLIYDESIEDVYGRYKGLIAPECVELIEKQVETKKKLKFDYYLKKKKKVKKNAKKAQSQKKQ